MVLVDVGGLEAAAHFGGAVVRRVGQGAPREAGALHEGLHGGVCVCVCVCVYCGCAEMFRVI